MFLFGSKEKSDSSMVIIITNYNDKKWFWTLRKHSTIHAVRVKSTASGKIL